MNKVTTISASQLSMYDTCPRQWHARYVLKYPQPPIHPAATVGSAVHKILELSLKAYINNVEKWKDPFKIIKPALKQWKLHNVEEKEEINESVHMMIKNAQKMKWFERYETNTFLEEKIVLDINDVKVIGYIDRLDDWDKCTRVVDLKTGKHPYSIADLKDNWQSKIYAYNFLKQGKETRTEFWFLKSKDKPWIIRKPEEKDEIKLSINEKINEMKNCDGTQYKINRFCKWCLYYTECNKINNGEK